MDAVSLQLGGGDLAHNVTVGDADNHAVLGGLVLVLVLGEHATTLTVVSLSLTPPPVLDLVTLEVSIVLLNLDETHFECRYLLCKMLRRETLHKPNLRVKYIKILPHYCSTRNTSGYTIIHDYNRHPSAVP